VEKGRGEVQVLLYFSVRGDTNPANRGPDRKGGKALAINVDVNVLSSTMQRRDMRMRIANFIL
jgi:hypothetical protein